MTFGIFEFRHNPSSTIFKFLTFPPLVTDYFFFKQSNLNYLVRTRRLLVFICCDIHTRSISNIFPQFSDF